MREKVERRDAVTARYCRKYLTRKPYRVRLRGGQRGDFRGGGGPARESRGCRTVDLSRLRLNSSSACERRLSTTCAWLTADSALGRSSRRLVSFSTFLPSPLPRISIPSVLQTLLPRSLPIFSAPSPYLRTGFFFLLFFATLLHRIRRPHQSDQPRREVPNDELGQQCAIFCDLFT